MTRKWLAPLLILLALAVTVLLFPRLPAEVPTHWNWRGEVNDTTARWPGAFIAPLAAAAVWLLLPLLRRIDPRRQHYERFDETFWLLLNVLTIGLLAIHGLTLAAALGTGIDMTRSILGGVGLLVAVLGNYLPRLRSNWWLGIRTPWTLESEDVWRRTHRLAGRTFVSGGLLCLAAVLLPGEVAAMVSLLALGLAALIPVVYSYVIYRRERS